MKVEHQGYPIVQIVLYVLQEFGMTIVSEIENVFFELLFFEHRYLVYYSELMPEILISHSKHS